MRKFCGSSLCAFLMIVIAGSVLAEQKSWTGWRGQNRDGRSTATGLLKDWSKPPKLLWQMKGLGSGYASPSIADGIAYTTGGNTTETQVVLAIDLSTQKILWKTPLVSQSRKHGYPGSRCTPAIDGDHLYVIGSDGSIACLLRESGDVKWQKNFKSDFGGKMMSGWGYSESPLVDGDMVVFTPGGANAMIVALNKVSGDEVWRSQAPASEGKGKDGAGYSSIVISNGGGVKQYVTLVGRGVIGVRASDGKQMWTYNAVANGTANIPTPIVEGDFVFCSSGYGTGSGLLKLKNTGNDMVSAEEQYFLDSKTLQNHHGGMIKDGDYIYCGHAHNKGFPRCVEMKTGKVVWGEGVRGEGKGSAAVLYVDGNMIFRYQSGDVVLIEASPKGYKMKGKFMPVYQKGSSWAHPVVVNGKLYLREQDVLMCYSLTETEG